MFTKVNFKPGRESDRRKDAMRAEAERRLRLLRAEVDGACRRLGVKPDSNGRVEIHQLDRILASSGLSTQQRIFLKYQKAQLGMID